VSWNLPPANTNNRICAECCCRDGLMADLVHLRAIVALNRVPGCENETLVRCRKENEEATRVLQLRTLKTPR
jgi:hypothetical protein